MVTDCCYEHNDASHADSNACQRCVLKLPVVTAECDWGSGR
jgi:hypothetical protein